jgi:Leucine-rich repeat (LRR) protein
MVILEGCTNLVELHESIEHLKGIVLLNLNGCMDLKNLPRSISNLKSLERLNLSGCLKLDELPKKLGNMIALKELLIERTAIKQLPSSFGILKNLKDVSLPGCKGQFLESLLSSFSSWISPKSLLRASVFRFCSLGRLVLNKCNLSEDEILIDLGSLSSLQGLDLSQNNFRNLPDCISRLPKLQYLYLDQCRSLYSIVELPTNLEVLYAYGCSSMETLSILPDSQLACLCLSDCCKLVEVQGLSLDSNSLIHLDG